MADQERKGFMYPPSESRTDRGYLDSQEEEILGMPETTVWLLKEGQDSSDPTVVNSIKPPRIAREISINPRLGSPELALEREARERSRDEGDNSWGKIVDAISAYDPTGQKAAALDRKETPK